MASFVLSFDDVMVGSRLQGLNLDSMHSSLALLPPTSVVAPAIEVTLVETDNLRDYYVSLSKSVREYGHMAAEATASGLEPISGGEHRVAAAREAAPCAKQ